MKSTRQPLQALKKSSHLPPVGGQAATSRSGSLRSEKLEQQHAAHRAASRHALSRGMRSTQKVLPTDHLKGSFSMHSLLPQGAAAGEPKRRPYLRRHRERVVPGLSNSGSNVLCR